ncbi:hypothetical protein ACQ27_gp254 [Klebsiella phage K64-1]|nr:hypothetical protein ACQ27_gp254 [Klebsiella phage K64-1]
MIIHLCNVLKHVLKIIATTYT